MATSTATALEEDNGYGEGGSIKIINASKTRPSSLNLIETKKAVTSHVIVVVVVVDILLLFNRP